MIWKSLKNAAGKGVSSGQSAENFAAGYLKKQGVKIIEQNYRKKTGEIDIIASHADQLLFIEVRLRNHRQFASGAESVDHRKQQKLIVTADQYLQEHYGNLPPSCRFDVVSLAAKGDNGTDYRVEWLKDAFRPL